MTSETYEANVEISLTENLWAAIERFSGDQSHVLNLFRTKLKATV